MTTQYDINKDMISLVGSLSDGINQLQKAVQLIHTEINGMIKMLMSYGMNKYDAKRCVLKILFYGTDLFYEI